MILAWQCSDLSLQVLVRDGKEALIHFSMRLKRGIKFLLHLKAFEYVFLDLGFKLKNFLLLNLLHILGKLLGISILFAFTLWYELLHKASLSIEHASISLVNIGVIIVFTRVKAGFARGKMVSTTI